ncbi:putative Zinc finger, RING-CH-type, Zinc finger, RING/FYVE/PHD-type [Helianthus debilis subsp. tardiflorus]
MADSSSSSTAPPDLECGDCFSEEEEEGSCFYSTCGGDDPEIDRESSKDCRICHLGLVEGDDAIELGCCCKNDLAAAHKHCAETWFKIKGNKTCEICNSIVSNLVEMPMPCSTHHVAVLDVNLEAAATPHESLTTTTRGGGLGRGGGGGGGCINGHRLLNFILACLVFAFVISWLFHFNIPS